MKENCRKELKREEIAYLWGKLINFLILEVFLGFSIILFFVIYFIRKIFFI